MQLNVVFEHTDKFIVLIETTIVFLVRIWMFFNISNLRTRFLAQFLELSPIYSGVLLIFSLTKLFRDLVLLFLTLKRSSLFKDLFFCDSALFSC
jgi:hypothetical protein